MSPSPYKYCAVSRVTEHALALPPRPRFLQGFARHKSGVDAKQLTGMAQPKGKITSEVDWRIARAIPPLSQQPPARLLWYHLLIFGRRVCLCAAVDRRHSPSPLHPRAVVEWARTLATFLLSTFSALRACRLAGGDCSRSLVPTTKRKSPVHSLRTWSVRLSRPPSHYPFPTLNKGNRIIHALHTHNSRLNEGVPCQASRILCKSPGLLRPDPSARQSSFGVFRETINNNRGASWPPLSHVAVAFINLHSQSNWPALGVVCAIPPPHLKNNLRSKGYHCEGPRLGNGRFHRSPFSGCCSSSVLHHPWWSEKVGCRLGKSDPRLTTSHPSFLRGPSPLAGSIIPRTDSLHRKPVSHNNC